MKKRALAGLLICLAGAFLHGAGRKSLEPHFPWACTSFAVYSDSPLYGMNFDYSDVPVQFTIQEFGDLKVFQMEFRNQSQFVPTVGMNSAGLFASSQILLPEQPTTRTSKDTLNLWQLFRAGLYRHHNAAQVLDLIEDYKIINSGLTLHDLFADPTGEAFILEVLNAEEKLTAMTGDYIIMTNFPVSSFQGQPVSEIGGAGADRYQIADRIIRENIADFQVEEGFLLLEEAAMRGDVSTQASMVFDPINQQVYIALNLDFSKIWMASLRDNSIRTWRGFSGQGSIPLDYRGVTEKELIELELSDSEDLSPIQGVLLPVVLFSILALFSWSFQRANQVNKRDK